MEYKNYAFWVAGTLEFNKMQMLFESLYDIERIKKDSKYRNRTVGNMIGCDLIATSGHCIEVINDIRQQCGVDVKWYITIVDRKKYFLAKLKYGI